MKAQTNFVQEELEEGPLQSALHKQPPRAPAPGTFCFQGAPGHPDSLQTLQHSEWQRRCCRIPGTF